MGVSPFFVRSPFRSLVHGTSIERLRQLVNIPVLAIPAAPDEPDEGRPAAAT